MPAPSLKGSVLLTCCLIAIASLALQPRIIQLISSYTGTNLFPTRSGGVQAANNSPDRWSQDAVAGAFKRYAELSNGDLNKMRTAYEKLGSQYQGIGEKLDYPAKLAKLDQANKRNGKVAGRIADAAVREYKMNATNVSTNRQGSLFRVQEALLHYMRDWSEEGQEEREVIFKPVLNLLGSLDSKERAGKTVLLPGSGLGRLAWDISELGYTSTACEYSYYMILALRYILNPILTTSPNSHRVQPFAHRWSHQRTAASAFRSIPFPDVVPRLSKRFSFIEGDFFKVTPPTRSDGSKGYDYIVTLFFIDTSSNVAQTLEHIHSLLAPGGTWINMGPLLWAAAGQAGFELSLEEVMQLAGLSGFEVDQGKNGDESVNELTRPRTVDCEYTGDKYGMFKRLYRAEFWTARKV